jgi:tetratricopeptide (TPR) repeat protein
MAVMRTPLISRPERAARRWSRLAPPIVGILAAAPFLPALANGFVNFDDDRLVVRNPFLRLEWPERLGWMWSTTYMGHYQPLTWMSLSIDRALGGIAPLAFHADSILLHAIAAVVLFHLIKMLLTVAIRGSRDVTFAAAAGALVWAVHPLRVESVAWVAERRDPLSALFYFLALVAYLRSVRVGHPELRSQRWYFASLALFACSILAKAWAISLFVVLAILDWYPLARLPGHVTHWFGRRNARIWIQKLPFAVIGIAFAALAWIAQRTAPDTMVGIARWTVKDRVLQALYGLCFYPVKTLWPTRLAALYELPETIRGVPLTYLACAVAVVVAAIAMVRARRSMPWLLAAFACYAVIVAPVLGLAQSGPQLVADRYSYLSCAAFSALIAGAVVHFNQRRIAAVLVALAVVVLGGLTWTQTRVWHDSATLWAHAIDTGHPSYVAHLDYGQALRTDGKIDEAIEQYREALALRPDAGNAWYNLANALKAKGDTAGAEQSYRQAIAHLSWKVDAYLNLGNLYYTQRRLGSAIEQYRAATTALDGAPPGQFTPEPYLYLGMALADSGDAAGARRALDVARRYPSTRARAEAELKRLGD